MFSNHRDIGRAIHANVFGLGVGFASCFFLKLLDHILKVEGPSIPVAFGVALLAGTVKFTFDNENERIAATHAYNAVPYQAGPGGPSDT